MGIVVHRPRTQDRRPAFLNDASKIHDGDVVTEVIDYAEVVTDKNQRKPKLLAQVREQVEYLRAHGDVEARDGLVGHDKLWADGKGPRDVGALALPSGEFVRESARQRGGKTDNLQQPVALVSGFSARHDLVDEQGLEDRVADPNSRIEGRIGVLKHDLQTKRRGDRASAHPREIDSLIGDRACVGRWSGPR